MDIYGKIGMKLQEIAGTNGQSPAIFTAQVSEVTGQTCTVKVGELPLSDVRLRAVINTNDEQVLVKPRVGSYVLVADLSGGMLRHLAVVSYSEVDEVSVKIDTQTLVVSKDGFVFNGGTDGMVKVGDMVGWMQKVYNDLQTLKTQLSTHPVAGNSAPLGMVFTPTAPSPTKSAFENTKIKH